MINKGTIDNSPTKSGNNTFTGNNDFKGPCKFFAGGTVGLITQSTKYAYTDIPTASTGICNFEINDKNGTWFAMFGSELYTDGRNVAKMQVKGKDDSVAAIRLFITSDGKDSFGCSDGIKKSIVNFSMPNYSGGIALSNNTQYTAPNNGFIIGSGTCSTSADSTVKIGTTVISKGHYSTDHKLPVFVYMPVKSGDKITVYFTGDNYGIKFFPCVGG